MNEAPETAVGAGMGSFRPRLTYYHPNSKNTGSALQLELHPAHDAVGGSLFADLAPQRTAGVRDARGEVKTFPSFDWRNKLSVKLDLTDLVQVLSVFRGIQESIADGKGLFHRSSSAVTAIHLEHRIDPTPGYSFDIWRKPNEGEARRGGFFFSPAEACGLSIAIEQVIGVIAFGIPAVQPRTGRLTEQGPAFSHVSNEWRAAVPDATT